MQLTDFNYDLPKERIAHYPLKTRSASRLLCLTGKEGQLTHRQFSAVSDLIDEGDLIIFNDTKVIPARLFGQKTTGGQVEILVERVLDDSRLLVQMRVSKPPKTGDYLLFADHHRFSVLQRNNQFYELRYLGEQAVIDVIEAIGQIPLPHYMERGPDSSDKERYQTIYAKHKGSVAAPTAGLHFDEALLRSLQDKKIAMEYLTLHIGAGTFAPVRVNNIKEHKMHAEYFTVSADLCEKITAAKARGKRVIAVGTTTLRALETACQSGEILPYQGETSIFIYPGYSFRCVDALITNLHLPCSTLLMLVCAFGGYEAVMHAYREAVKQSYRFYSYGDAMWVERQLKCPSL